MPHPAARRVVLTRIAFVALLAILPVGAIPSREPAQWVAIRPLETISHALVRGPTFATVVSVIGNVAAFVPVGLLAPAGWARWRSWPAALALGLGVSLTIEAAQLTISIAVGVPYRRADGDDPLLHGLGPAIGYGAWRAAAWRRAAA